VPYATSTNANAVDFLLEITARGDDETYPQIGDIVRVRYSAFVVPDPKDKKKKDEKPKVNIHHICDKIFLPPFQDNFVYLDGDQHENWVTEALGRIYHW
jgi:hypothetical protein